MYDAIKWEESDVNVDQRIISDLQNSKLDITMKFFGMIQVVL